ncbi:LuxR C-terminal-related transcriptional regulator [Nonomuraea sp. NPDC005983]|uniref:helix-turn-helix transcriptional regulator n=1 Tax=Nonomuraea sp. NPDC005983 TaxID=3155595 RepID=UPI0033A83113
MECAAITVPVDWSTPGKATIKLDLARLPATEPSLRLGSVLVVPDGGPGIQGVLSSASESFTKLRRYFDVVGYNPRTSAAGTVAARALLGPSVRDELAGRVETLRESRAEVVKVADAGGTALDPEVVAQLLVRRHSNPLNLLTRRECEVLTLIAEGRSNTGIAEALVVSDSAVGKHINNIFAKLGLSGADKDHRRVLAVLRFLKI